jgi:16S rRNA processing protein RimM
LVVIADLLRPRGNRGEVLVASQTDVPGRLESLKKATVRFRNGQQEQVEIESAWPHRDLWVLKFAGVDSISAAERFSGAELVVPVGERGKLGDGEFFQSDLIGCELIDKLSGKPLGTVTGFQQCGGPPLMEADVDGREVLVPFVPSICQEVDLREKKIRVELPEGLLEL